MLAELQILSEVEPIFVASFFTQLIFLVLAEDYAFSQKYQNTCFVE